MKATSDQVPGPSGLTRPTDPRLGMRVGDIGGALLLALALVIVSAGAVLAATVDDGFGFFVLLVLVPLAVPPALAGRFARTRRSTMAYLIGLVVGATYGLILVRFAIPSFAPKHDYEQVMQVGAALATLLAVAGAILLFVAAATAPSVPPPSQPRAKVE